MLSSSCAVQHISRLPSSKRPLQLAVMDPEVSQEAKRQRTSLVTAVSSAIVTAATVRTSASPSWFVALASGAMVSSALSFALPAVRRLKPFGGMGGPCAEAHVGTLPAASAWLPAEDTEDRQSEAVPVEDLHTTSETLATFARSIRSDADETRSEAVRSLEFEIATQEGEESVGASVDSELAEGPHDETQAVRHSEFAVATQEAEESAGATVDSELSVSDAPSAGGLFGETQAVDSPVGWRSIKKEPGDDLEAAEGSASHAGRHNASPRGEAVIVIDDSDVEAVAVTDMDYVQAGGVCTALGQSNPSANNGAPTLDVIFLSDCGRERHRMVFSRGPLGLNFVQGKVPLTIRTVEGHAEELGAQPGWEVESVDGERPIFADFRQACCLVRAGVVRLPMDEAAPSAAANDCAVPSRYREASSRPMDAARAPVRRLLLQESFSDWSTKTRICDVLLPEEFGEDRELPERVVLVVGATGAGKSTLVNAMVNHALGIRWSDPFRYVLVEPSSGGSPAHSQTDWTTAYRLGCRDGMPLPFALTIVDTPGFGDTRGPSHDVEIARQLRGFFALAGSNSACRMTRPDAVCFVVQASLPRLTSSQRYIFDAVLSLFGKDIEEKINVCFTFADAQQPPALAALKEVGIPFRACFKFNNSAVFAAPNRVSHEQGPPTFDQMSWHMGARNLSKLFSAVGSSESQLLTKDVLKERERLETAVEDVQPHVPLCLQKLEELKIVEQMCPSQNRLSEIATRPNPIGSTECINLLMQSEKRDGTSGWRDRVRALEELQLKPQIVTNVLEECYVPCRDACK